MAKANLENEKFGIEIEVAGQTRAKIAQAVKEAVDGTITAINSGGGCVVEYANGTAGGYLKIFTRLNGQ